MSLLSLATPGRLLIVAGNLAYGIGAYIADYNHTHVFNPRWPAHAKFHNGQTMTLGVLLASTSIYFAYASTAPNASAEDARQNLLASAWVGNLYCLAGLSAIWYPGTAWVDAEFRKEGQVTQKPVFATIVGLIWLGYAIERWRMG